MATQEHPNVLASSRVQETQGFSYSAWTKSGPFQYNPLWRKGSIRLLHLLPGEPEDSISCEIEHISMDEGIEYNALSYAWGDQKEKEAISVFGKEFQITRSLAGTLRTIRQPDRTVPVWADAICIDQADVSEQSEQVGMMRDIYANANQVIIWLGDASDMSKLGMTLISKAKTLPTEEWANIMIETKGEADFLKMMLLGFMDIFGRPWWRRLWIVQEVAVASHGPLVFCGSECISWSAIEELGELVQDSGKGAGFWEVMNGAGMGVIRDMVLIRNSVQDNGHLSLSRLLDITTQRKFTMPVDRIYALLGMTSPEVREAIPIDYNTSLERLYIDVARVCIKMEENLNLLSYVQCLEEQTPRAFLDDSQWAMMEALRMSQKPALSLPSWVPDWSQPYNQRNQLLFQESTYHASKGMKCDISLNEDTQSIVVSGMHLNSVAVVHDDMYDSSKIKNSLIELENTASLASLTLILDDDDDVRAQVMEDDFWRTLVANRTQAGEWPAPEQWAEAIKVSKREAEVPDFFQPHVKQPIDRFANFVMPLQKQLIHAMGGRRFFVTQRGLFGIGPCNIRKGDAVCILFGADLPMVLRQESNHWRLLGECYVHRAAAGEGIELHLRNQDEFPKVKFVIR